MTTTVTPATMRRQLMTALVEMSEEGDVLGWDLWLKIAADHDYDPKEIKTGPYKRFKDEVADLRRLGFLVGVGQGRAVARLRWDLTAEGEDWWEEQREQVDPADRAEKPGDFIRGKWLTRGAAPQNRATWSKLAAMALRGEIQIAIRETP